MTVFRFDDVEVDAAAFLARKAGVPVPLEPKALEVLLVLVRSEGRLVTKAALQEAVWPRTFVTEGTLTRLVAQLRKTLGDDARDAHYIETVPTRGYRFVARVNGSPSPAPPSADLEASRPGPGPAPSPGPPGKRRVVGLVGLACVVAIVAASAIFSRRTPLPVPQPSPVRSRMLVSTASGFNAYPAFSPDGSSLAFSSDRTGALEIWIRPLVPGARELQVTSDGHNNVQPAWSPDGRLLAFTSVGRGGIWMVPALGGVPRQVTTFGSRPVWSPDGGSLAFLSNEMVQIDIAGSSTSRIWLVPAAGGAPRPLTERWDPPGGHRSVSFAPDGRRLAFTAGGQVWLLDLASGKRERVDVPTQEHRSNLLEFGASGEVQWASDGRSLVGLARQAHEVVLWRYDLGSGRAEISAPLMVAEPTQFLEHLALSADGRRMAYSLVSTNADLMSLPLDRDGTPLSQPAPLLPSLASRKGQPQFSLDGGRISFQVWRPGEGGVLYTASSDGRNPAQAANVSAFAGASFDPEGRLIAVVRGPSDRPRLIEIDPATGRERTLRDLPPAAWPRLSPDGKEVAFMCGGEPLFAVCVAGAEGGEPQPLVAPKDGAGWPVWSPDGRHLAIELFDGEDTFIAVVPRAGGAPRRVTREPGQSWPHSWTPDGRSVVFAGQRRGIWNVYTVDVATGRERRITSYDRAVLNVRYPAWSPAGDRVAFEQTEMSANVWAAPLPWP
jgi:Tol biopolymer transport system component/DNA-binding winged helix-turn-helix (wHTH) protein